MKYLLGIDAGSTSLKVIAFNLDGSVQASASRPTEAFPQDSSHPEWIVWMPESIWGGIADSIKEVVSQLGDPRKIEGIAVTGLGMDGLPIDKNGKWLYPFISFRDSRTMPQHQWWLGKFGAEKVFRICGRPPLHIGSINRIMWVKENEPQILEKTDKWLLIEDFINFMLCGVHSTDYSMAATTQVFDCKKRNWSDELIEAAGVRKGLFPEIKQSGTLLGEVHASAAKRTGLKEGTPVVLGGHDYLCGAFASAGSKPGSIVNITGTWEVTVAQCQLTLEKDTRKSEFLWDSHVIRNAYGIVNGAIAADMAEWYRRQFARLEEELAEKQGRSVWSVLMDEVAELEPGSNGVTFLPHFSGMNFPLTDPKSHGAFVGISNFATRPSFMRSIIEGLNYQSRQLVEGIEEMIGAAKHIIAIGGTVRNEFWMQNKADILNKVIEIPDLEEASCLGVAMLAGIGVGLYKDEEDAFDRIHRPGITYQPDATRAKRYDELFHEIYLPLYETLKPIHRSIYDLFRG